MHTTVPGSERTARDAMDSLVPPLTREQIGRILRRHKGSQIAIADALGIRGSSVNTWLQGKSTSARIAEAAQKKAIELLEVEKATA
jgi:predicted transcriptional regulator